MGGKDGDRMPVEESGNMLIMLAALAKVEGNANLAKQYWPMLTKWADYLVKEGLDPQNQLCSADMFGHMPRASNLALKAIIGIGGYAQLCEMARQTRNKPGNIMPSPAIMPPSGRNSPKAKAAPSWPTANPTRGP